MLKNLMRRGASSRRLRGAGSLLAILALVVVASSPSAADAPPLVVAFVYVSPIGEAGWTYQHELGRRDMARALGSRVKTIAVESVAEGPDAERVMRDLVVSQGAKLVFATSFGYLDPALRVAADFPAVKFEHAGGYKTAANLATYDARYYEARWLAGYLAGQTSRSGVSGYVAGFPVPEVVQGINAFTLGMRAANPKARVRVLWLNTWFDPAKEREAAQSLIDQGADVLTQHSGSAAVAQTAQANFRSKGIRVVPYPSDMHAFAPDAQLCAVVHHWGGFYTRVAESVLAGTWKPESVWGGISSGMVDIAAIDPKLPSSVRATVLAKRQAIVDGAFKPFSAPLRDNAGKLRLASGSLDDAKIKTMNWFVEGVIGSVPAAR
ncbi:MAG: BMP family ABC transporter substrate-binding protein [Pseudomonadota bacterium]|nr:BMP family ABC transporter substrate-binding protein [Pseudomonadota bacterium]